jgi:NAD(P)H-dependent FMN reductase/DNA-binding MarR family transcriptional regulator
VARTKLLGVEARAKRKAAPSTDLGIVDGLVQLSSSIQTVLSQVAAGFGLSVLQGRLLGVLRDREPTMAQLGRLLDLDKSSTTGLVDRAQRRGLVHRVEVILTTEGGDLAASFVAEVGRLVTALTDGISDANRQRLSRLASQIVLQDAAAHGVDLSAGTDQVALPSPDEPGALDTGTGQRGRVGVVVGSTRPTRICLGIAEWVRAVAQQDSPLHYQLLDLAEVDLPFLDEPLNAALQHYEHEHTRAWSRTVSSYDGFIFVFPQYNWGYPAPLKNALDYLYVEWKDKPASYVTYGTRGGNKAAEQFHGVLGGLHMRELDDHLEVVITDDDVDEPWQLRDIEATLRPYATKTKAIDAAMVEALQDSQ